MNSFKMVSISVLFSAVLCASALAGVATVVTVEGHVTNVSSTTVEIDGKAYPIEAGSQAAHDLAGVQRGDAVSIAVSPKRTSGVVTASHPVEAGHEVVYEATNKSKTTVKVVHAPGVR